jgi:hypothetical protein
MISNRLYDRLKWVVRLFLPLLGTLYFAFSKSLELAHTSVVLGAILAVDLLIGVVLCVSDSKYDRHIGQGELMVEEDGDGAMGMRLALDQTPEELAAKKEVRFTVQKYQHS